MSSRLPLHEIETTCLVVGGGPAGYGAAWAALRGGCPTLLVERHGYLGGMGTAAGLSCHLNHRAGGQDIAGAAYREFVQTQAELGAHYYDDLAQADFFEPEICKRVMESKLQAAGGKLLFHVLLVRVVRDDSGEDGPHWLADFASKGAIIRVRTRYLIDTTGDADACALAGAPMTHGRRSDGKTQPMSMVVQLGGFDPEAWRAAGERLVAGRYATEGERFAREIDRARAASEWTIPRTEIALFWAMPTDPTRITVNGTRINGFSACDPLDTTAAEIEGRRQAAELLRFFRKYVHGFSRAYLLQTGPQIGVRESRRIVGRATLTEDEVRGRVISESSVVLCAYPIDVHAPDGDGTQYERTSDDQPHVYGIPWECLLPADVDAYPNLAVAGRCISATHEAAGSFRVMPTCMGLGEAAGTAVALANGDRSRTLHEITGKEVRAALGTAREESGVPPLEQLFPPESENVPVSPASSNFVL